MSRVYVLVSRERLIRKSELYLLQKIFELLRMESIISLRKEPFVNSQSNLDPKTNNKVKNAHLI